MIGGVPRLSQRLSRMAGVISPPSPSARFHPPSHPAIGRRHGRGGVHRVRAVHLHRRSGHVHGRARTRPSRIGHSCARSSASTSRSTSSSAASSAAPLKAISGFRCARDARCRRCSRSACPRRSSSHSPRRCSRSCSAFRPGVYTALRRDSWLSHILLAVSLIGVSLPTFLIGILLILVFAVMLGWLPSFGRGDTVALGWWTTGFLTKSGLKALILPSITLLLFQMTLIMRLVRAEMLEVLRTDYIKFARARGLTDRAIHFGHALKNTLVPVITITGLQLGAIIAFAIITETVFQWPGMGLLFIQAVGFADVPVMAAYLCFIALVFVLINLVVDLLYYAVDPRLRIERLAVAH